MTVRERLINAAGSGLLLGGALLIGAVLHRSLVLGEFAVTSPISVGGIVFGVVLVIVGRSIKRRTASAVQPVETDEEEEDVEEEEFDPAMSPFEEGDLEEYERDG